MPMVVDVSDDLTGQFIVVAQVGSTAIRNS